MDCTKAFARFRLPLLLLAVLFVAGIASADTSPLLDTKEYQLGLNEDDFEGQEGREDAINEYVDFIKDRLDLDDFDSRFSTQIDLRREAVFDTDNCDMIDSTNVRIRVWFSGSNVGLSSIDSKTAATDQTRQESINTPAQPGDEYEDQADQDIEEGSYHIFFAFPLSSCSLSLLLHSALGTPVSVPRIPFFLSL